MTTLENKGREDINYMLERLKPVSHIYEWDFNKTIEGLRNYRNSSLIRFISDYVQGKKQGRYVKAQLPKLPFDDKVMTSY